MVALLQHIHASSWCIQNHYSDGLERTEQAIPPHSSSVSIAVTPNNLRVFWLQLNPLSHLTLFTTRLHPTFFGHHVQEHRVTREIAVINL